MKSLPRRIAEHFDRDEQSGLAIVWFVLTIGIFLVVAAFAVDLVHAYVEQQAAQKAADAAALAGAAEIPNDPTGGAVGGVAYNRAIQLAQDNGWTGARDTIEQPVVNANTMTVTVDRTFDTFFGGFIGIGNITVRKTATAIYDGPVQMGSPANNLGDVPECPPGVPIGGCTPANVVSPPANATQNLFVQIEGPNSIKQAGNAYTTGYCNGDITVDGCKQGAGAGFGKPPQLEYDSQGENIIVHNTGGTAQLWIYDAPFVGTNADCQAPLQSALLHDPAGVTGWPDNVYNNYGNSPGPPFNQFVHCAGDIDLIRNAGGGPGATQMKTTYALYAPDADSDPTNNATPETGCAPKQYNGYKDPNDAWTSGDADVRATWHQWAMLCTFSDSGDLVLRVSGDASGAGMNSFSVLALRPSGSTSGLTVSTTKALPLFAHTLNAGGTTQFYVARVLPSPGRDRTLNVEFFDFGDEVVGTSTSGQIDFAWENVNSPSPLQGCKWQPPPPQGANGRDDPLNPATLNLVTTDPYSALTDASHCSFHYNKAQWNGRWVVIAIPIPGTGPNAYGCDQTQAGNCWLKLKVTPSGGQLGDATTWNARMGGSPVALLH